MESDVKVKKYCRMCGKAHKAKYSYCKLCGVNLDDADIDEIYESNISDVAWPIGASICIYIFFVSIGLYFWMEYGAFWGGFFIVPLIAIVPLGIIAFVKYLNRWKKLTITQEKIEYSCPYKLRTVNWSEFDVINLKAKSRHVRHGVYVSLKFYFFRYNEQYPVRKLGFISHSKPIARQTLNLVTDFAKKMNKQLNLERKRI